MATSEAQDSTLKRRARRRLIGAIALVLLAVIVLPMVFDAEKRPLDADISIQIPNQDAVVAKGINPAPGTAGAPAVPVAGKGGSKVDENESRETKAEQKAVADAPKAAAKVEDQRSAKDRAEEQRAAAILNAKDASAKAEKSAPVTGGFAVQVGAFAADDKVQEARDKLSSAGIKTYTEKLDTKTGERTRVRAGPFASKDAADEARDKIRGLGFAGAQVVAR